MTIERARDLVYGFADIVAVEKPFIGDASVLPCIRSELRIAFSVYLKWMYSEREKDPAAFERDGYGGTLRAAECCSLMVDDFHDIAPEDVVEVKRINSSIASPADMGYSELKMMAKYLPGGATT